jgi:hypothetical protein
MEKDRELLDLKRINALSMHRIEENHKRLNELHEEKALYYEDTINMNTLNTSSVTSHEFKQILKHVNMDWNVRYVMLSIYFGLTALAWRVIFLWYSNDPLREFQAKPKRLIFATYDWNRRWSDEMRQHDEVPVAALLADKAKKTLSA